MFSTIVYRTVIMSSNSTRTNMDEFPAEILYDQEKDDFDHPFPIKIVLSIFTIVILISTYFINRRLFLFLRRPNRRLLDFIVDFQYSIGIVVVFICMLFFNIIIWIKVPKTYVSTFGCYFGTYLFYFMAPYSNCHSFFISFFRFICILHPDRLNSRGITPQVSK